VVHTAVKVLKQSREDEELREDIESMPFDSLIRKYICQAIKYAKKEKGHTRADIARLLSKKSNRKISEHIMNRYTRADDQGLSFPLDLIEAFVEVTGDARLAVIIPTRMGFKVLNLEERDVWDYYQAVADEEIARKKREFLEQKLLKKSK
jgi:hypothetical protein